MTSIPCKDAIDTSYSAAANLAQLSGEIAALRQEVAELRALYQDVFNMAARAVADIADAADKEA